MAVIDAGATAAPVPAQGAAAKGLKSGALGLVSDTVVGVASTAPAYSLAATIGFVVVLIGPQTPAVAVLAFIPMLFIAFAYNEMNKADPDCGTVFTWGVRAFRPRIGWMGGWGLIAADVLVMASLAQIAGQYLFLLFNNHSIGDNASSNWVLLVGILWIVVMSYICYRGIELSANIQKALLGIELSILLLFSVVALVKVGIGHAPPGHMNFSWSWFDPFKIPSLSTFIQGTLLMLFIYWGWDTAVSVNEETKDPDKVPGQAAVLSTLVLLATYALVIVAAQSFAGLGTHGIGLGNSANANDIFAPLGSAVFGTSGFGTALSRLLIFMVLTSAAASTQTTILPNARTTLSMAVYKALPNSFARVHKRYLTPTVSTVVFGVVSIALYVVMNNISAGSVIADSVSALGILIAFYYGLTGFTSAWYHRKTVLQSQRNLWMQGIFPLLGGLLLWGAMGYSFWFYWSPTRSGSATSWHMQFWPHWDMSGVFVIDVIALVLGVVLMFLFNAFRPPFFRGEVLNKDTPTMVPENVYALDTGLPDLHRHPPAATTD